MPLTCPNGHTLVEGEVLVGWRACGCPGARHGGHRTWTCRRCLELGVPDERITIYATTHDPHHGHARGQRGPELTNRSSVDP